MLGLPKSTELSKQLPKKAIYTKFNMDTKAREKFDADISKITIVAEISPTTTTIAVGTTVPSIYVLLVSLKKKDFNPNTITQLSKLINQKMLLVLECGTERKLAINHNKLIQSEWQPIDACAVSLKGLNLDAVWENIVVQVGSIDIEGENSLDEQILIDEKREKILKEIAHLETQARKEKQPKRKFELVEKINTLRKELL